MAKKTISTPAEAIKLLTKPFDNKRGLHRMNVDQAQQIAEVVADLNIRNREARTYLPMLMELSHIWYIKLLFPSLAADIEDMDATLQSGPITIRTKLL